MRSAKATRPTTVYMEWLGGVFAVAHEESADTQSLNRGSLRHTIGSGHAD